MASLGKRLWAKVKQVTTLGMINHNPHTGEVIYKGPLTGLGNLIAQTKDAILHNPKTGVWLGKKTKNGKSGTSAYYKEFNSQNTDLDYAVRVNGKAWEVKDSQLVTISEDSWNHYQWFYKGETVHEVGSLIESMNANEIEVEWGNSAIVSKSIYLYARGRLTKETMTRSNIATRQIVNEAVEVFKDYAAVQTTI